MAHDTGFAETRRGFLGYIGSAAFAAVSGCQGNRPASGTIESTQGSPSTTAATTQGGRTSTTTSVSDGDVGSWPTFQYDYANTGHTTDVAGPKTRISERWVAQFDAETTQLIRSSPTIADGTVFVGSGPTVYAIDVADGVVQWQTSTDGIVDGAPLVTDGGVFANTRNGTLYRLGRSDGSVKWAFETGLPNPENRPSAPTLSRDGVLLGTANGLWAVDRDTGEERWHVLNEETTGSWSRIHSVPAVVDDTIYVGHPTGVYALTASDGGVVWRTDIPEDVYVSSPAVADGRVFIGARDGSLYVLDSETGERITRLVNEFDPTLPGSPSDEITTSPAVADGVVVAGSEDYHVYAWDVESEERLWRFPVGGRCYTSPAVADGVVYAGGVAGQLFGIDLRTGEERFRVHSSGQIIDSSPAVLDGLVCVVNHHGHVVMVEGQP